jgi:hypothetical protein
MASTFSPLLQIELIGIGDQNNTWGTTTNTNLGTLIEDAIAGSAAINVTAGNVTLTTFDGSADQARCAALRVTGTPGVSRNIIAPARSKIYVVANGSNAAVVLKTSTSTGLTIPTGEIYLAYFDTVLLDFKYIGQSASAINTPNTLVLRDATGSFGANVVAANTFSGDLNGTINTLTTAVTQTAGNNSTKVATTAYVNSAVTTATAALGTMSTQNANAVAITGGTISGITDLTVADGGTGVSTIAANAVVLGNGTSAIQTVAPSTNGNVLTSNGTTWQSTAPVNNSIGVGQTWQNVTVSRALNTDYTNSTGKPIQVVVSMVSQNGGGTGSTSTATALVAGVTVAFGQNSDSSGYYSTPITFSFIVPASAVYRVNTTAGSGTSVTLQQWAELR